MITRIRFGLPILLLGTFGVVPLTAGCSSDAAPAPPPGACRASPTAATGSSSAACTECAKSQCNTELVQKSGSGWASQYLGGDGACVAYDACACDCYRTSTTADQLVSCTIQCGAQLDSGCQAAITTAERCIDSQCLDVCR